MAVLSKKLATINTEAPVDTSFEDKKIPDMYTPEAYDIVKRLGFKNILQRFEDPSVKRENVDIEAVLVTDEKDAEALFEKCRSAKKVSVRVFVHDGPVGAAFFIDEEKGYFVPVSGMFIEGISEACLINGINEIAGTRDEDHILVTFGIKELYHFCPETADFDKVPFYFDTKLASYLLNPIKNDYAIDDVAIENGISIQSYKELFDKSDVRNAYLNSRDEFVRYAVKSAYVSYMACESLDKKLEANECHKLFAEIEMPLTICLYEMEREGIRVIPSALSEYGAELNDQIEALKRQIIEEAGEDFNINSPKQLGEILFEKMKLPGGKKTKTGYSTAAEVLEKLAVESPFVRHILDYRGLAKLKSTYADGLMPFIDANDRIHSTFHQTITATGRISSADPNLQNIPVRMEQGRLIRKVFVPKDGYIFLDADYSQIELRILAHMSQDETLTEAFREGKDIHRITASKVFRVPFDEVTSLQRRNAKAVNFGIIYGISSFGLAQDIGISTSEAKEFIDNYFLTFPRIKQFLDSLVKDAKERGYAKTLFNRRRPVPELKESNFMRRQFGERVAMNAPIQGTAADIMKIAMIRVIKRLRDEKLKTKVILQVHDELLLETELSEKERVSVILKEEMENAAELSVSLTVEMSEGNNWYEAK